MRYKRYICVVIGGALCSLLAIAFFNYEVDPANIFRNEVLVKTCGSWLLQGHDVAITQNYDERLLQKYLIEHDSQNYDVLILGSSRTMDIGMPLLSNRSVKNYSVSGASIEDDIALYYLYERLHEKPQKVIIGADAWLLNINNEQNRWKSLATEYDYGKGRMNGTEGKSSRISESVDYERYEQLISWLYLNESINKVIKKGWESGGGGYEVADNKDAVAANVQIKCSDGSIIRSAKILAADAEPKARQYISGNVYSLENYDALDIRLQMEVCEFISYLKAQGIEIVLYLTPYHPVVHSYFVQNEKYHNALEAETYFRNLAKEYDLRVVGSYNPERCGLSNADFLDGMHVRREAVERILRGKL